MSHPEELPPGEVHLVRAASITTMGPAGVVGAIAVDAGGRVLDAGEPAALRAAHPRAELVDLGAAHVLAGLVEAHTHPDLAAQMGAWVDVSGFRHREVAEVETALRDAARTTPAGSWIFAFGLDPMLSAPIGVWDRQRLDRLCPDHPTAVMVQSMHTLFVNSRALTVAGLDDGALDPPGGGRYGRDDAGRLDGIVREAPAMTPFLRHMDWSGERVRAGIAAQYERYRRAGITALGVAGTYGTAANDALLREVAATAPVRTTAYVRAPHARRLQPAEREGERFRVGGVKLWYDGSPYSGTMLLDEPYLDSELCCCTLGIPPGSVGHANFGPDEMLPLLCELAAGGWQVLTHAQGDRGCREILDLYASAFAETGRQGFRWRLEHCALVTEADLARSAALGVSPSFHVDHVRHYGPELRDRIIGPERAERLMPLAAALAQGHRISLHADTPMYPPGPLALVRTAVTRLTRNGDVLGARHAIGVHAALRAVTVDAAWQLGLDHEIGSLQPGRRADLTLLDADPGAVAPADIDRIEILGTWLDGRPT